MLWFIFVMCIYMPGSIPIVLQLLLEHCFDIYQRCWILVVWKPWWDRCRPTPFHRFMCVHLSYSAQRLLVPCRVQKSTDRSILVRFCGANMCKRQFVSTGAAFACFWAHSLWHLGACRTSLYCRGATPSDVGAW